MSHVWMDGGTVVIPFVNLEAAWAAYNIYRERGYVFKIRIPSGNKVLLHEDQEEKDFTVIEKNTARIVTMKLGYVIIPAVGPVTDRIYKLTKMAKIRLVQPPEVFHCLQHQATLQSMERPMAPPDWPLYRQGSFNK